ncbi:MAG: Flp pilus assembly complex ATPase component TadA [Helicobacteraceae bacterium]|jgi:type II secretory ATPase GspE/PulE/Tfp pilus assembly ATPase PilB-like protein|nr:Flp pilus assembly complex ATPase component TadA [Helicobacteraceae bacterium]
MDFTQPKATTSGFGGGGMRKLRLGDVLIAAGLLTQGDLERLLQLQKQNADGRKLGELIMDEGILSEEAILRTLADQMKVSYVEPGTFEGDMELAVKLGVNTLRRFSVVPMENQPDGYLIAFVDPLDIEAQDAVQRQLPDKPLIIAITAQSEVSRIISRVETQEGLRTTLAEVEREMAAGTAELQLAGAQQESAIYRLIEIIVATAIRRKGSDIHVEPGEKDCAVRVRIDGLLTESFAFPSKIYPPLSSRIKLLADLDIGERRKPQDGRFSMTVDKKEFDFRLSTLPIAHGESIVMRILDKSKTLVRLDQMGFTQTNLERFRRAMRQPNGIVFVTGPTGSGKTTTLYAALNEVKNVTHKIITVEDPVEYRMPGLQQVQTNEKAGLTFAGALRSILRQDPDIIMVGESRDKETISIAIQAALTGHLVFTTLHTNDAPSAITRVMDMGVEPFMIASSVVAVQAQRLVRRICPDCKKEIKYPKDLLSRIMDMMPKDMTIDEMIFHKGEGCKKCSGTGYAGRTMVSEVFTIDEEISTMIIANASKHDLIKVAKKKGYEEMFTDGLRKIAAGETTLEEVMRVAKV